MLRLTLIVVALSNDFVQICCGDSVEGDANEVLGELRSRIIRFVKLVTVRHGESQSKVKCGRQRIGFTQDRRR